MKFYTVGYGGRHPSELVQLLREHGVRTVVDVRAVPRGSMGAYTKAKSPEKGIERLLSQAEIGYRSEMALGNPWMREPD